MDETQEAMLELAIEPVPLWRVHSNLNVRGERIARRDDVLELKMLSDKSKQVLSAQGAISRVSAGPLSVLPGWKTRGKKLAALGIINVEQLLGVSNKALGLHLDRKPETIARWKNEAMDWLLVPDLTG